MRQQQYPGRDFQITYQKCLMAAIAAMSMETMELFLQAGASPDGPNDTTQVRDDLRNDV